MLKFSSRCLFCDNHCSLKIGICKQCENNLPYFNNDNTKLQKNTIKSVFNYQWPINHLITDLKFNRKIINAQFLGAIMVQRLQTTIKPNVLLPVPLHRSRLRQRGFNQALEICRPIQQYFTIPLLKHHVIRKKATKAQTGLNAEQRIKNLQYAFFIKKPIPYQHILVIDDVLTTGSTIQALTNTLMEQSTIKSVQVWTAAKAGMSKIQKYPELSLDMLKKPLN